jgi:hypothetical protein
MKRRIPPKAGGVLQVLSTSKNKWIDCPIIDVKPFKGISFTFEDSNGNKSIKNISLDKLTSESKFYRISK